MTLLIQCESRAKLSHLSAHKSAGSAVETPTQHPGHLLTAFSITDPTYLVVMLTQQHPQEHKHHLCRAIMDGETVDFALSLHSHESIRSFIALQHISSAQSEHPYYLIWSCCVIYMHSLFIPIAHSSLSMRLTIFFYLSYGEASRVT